MSLISFLLSIVILFELTFVVGAHLEWFVYDYFDFPRLGFAQIMGLMQLIHLISLLAFIFLILPLAYGIGYMIHLAT